MLNGSLSSHLQVILMRQSIQKILMAESNLTTKEGQFVNTNAILNLVDPLRIAVVIIFL